MVLIVWVFIKWGSIMEVFIKYVSIFGIDLMCIDDVGIN